MTGEKIKEYIERLNTENTSETIFIRKISDSVDVAKVWDKEPELNNDRSIISPSYRFFFIRNKDDKYVGAVLDMSSNLHWYVLEEERKKGYLTKALKESIIPYIFYDDYYLPRECQRITIERNERVINYKNSRRVAISLGFNPTNEDETEFELKKTDFDWRNENLQEKNRKISSKRFLELRNRLTFSYRQLLKISDELLMSYDDDKDLRELAREVYSYNAKIEDIEWENNK